MYEVVHQLFTGVSLAATSPTIAVAGMVLWRWHARYVAYCREEFKTPSLTLIAGVYWSFIGSFVDNSWWGVAWSLDYQGVPSGENWWFENGVFSNVLFRQGTGLKAGLLHLHADWLSLEDRELRQRVGQRAKAVLVVAVLLGAMHVGILELTGT